MTKRKILIGERIRRARKDIGLSQIGCVRKMELEDVGIESIRTQLSAAEIGKTLFPRKHMKKLARVLGTTEDYLLYGKGPLEQKVLPPAPEPELTSYDTLTDTPSSNAETKLDQFPANAIDEIVSHHFPTAPDPGMNVPAELIDVSVTRSIPFHHVLLMMKFSEAARKFRNPAAPTLAKTTTKEWDSFYNVIRPAILFFDQEE